MVCHPVKGWVLQNRLGATLWDDCQGDCLGYDKYSEHSMHQTLSAGNEFSVSSKLWMLPKRPLFCQVMELLPERWWDAQGPFARSFQMGCAKSALSGTVQHLLSLIKKHKSLQKNMEQTLFLTLKLQRKSFGVLVLIPLCSETVLH